MIGIHKFASGIADSSDGTLILASDWNADVMIGKILTNRTGVLLTAGDVVGIDADNNSSVELADVKSTGRPLAVLVSAPPSSADHTPGTDVANEETGVFASAGILTVRVAGATTRGNWLRKSATTKALEDTGVAQASSPPAGAVAVAMTSSGGAGTVVATFNGLGASSTGLGFFNVAHYGATGDGTTDDTTAVQAAITAAQAVGGVVFLPPGRYKISSTLTITAGCTIVGSGAQSIFDMNNGVAGGSVLFTTSTTLTLISVDTSDACHFRDFTLVGSAVASAGSGILVTGDTVDGISGCQRPTFVRLSIYGFFRGIEYDSCVFSTVASCVIVNYTDVGMLIQNTINGDHGDHHITDCLFSGATTGVIAGIRWHSSGGLYVTSTKILGNAVGIHLTLASGVQTVDFSVVGSSIENFSVQGVQVTAGTSGTSFLNVQIIGNNISSEVTDSVGILCLAVAGAVLDSVIIQGNSIKADARIISMTEVDNFVIQGNSLYGGDNGIHLDTTMTGNVSGNKFMAVTTPYLIDDATNVTLIELAPIFVVSAAPTVADGSQIYFTDAENSVDDAGGYGALTGTGSGNIAFRVNGIWFAL